MFCFVASAAVPPPIVRSVLTTNLPAFGSAGQALFRTTVLPYLAWSNLTVAPAPDTVLSNYYQTNWGVLYTNFPQVEINKASNSLYAISSNIAQALVDGGSNALYIISSNVAQALVLGGSNALYTVSSNVAQSLVNGGSNSLYTISSNIAVVLANIAMQTATNYTDAHTNFAAVAIGGGHLTNTLTIDGNIGFTSALMDGGAQSTNYTLMAGTNDVYIGQSNVNIVAIMGGTAGRRIPMSFTITNGTGVSWGISFSAVTNAWHWPYSQGVPSVLTNATQLLVQLLLDGSNVLAAWASYAWP